MDTVGASLDYPRVYRLSKTWTAIFLSTGILLFGLTAFIASKFAENAAEGDSVVVVLIVLVGLGMAGLGVCSVQLPFRYRLTLHPDRIEVREFLKRRVMERHDILGCRTILGTPSLIVLIPRNQASRQLKISRVFKLDEVFLDWLKDLPDLDAEDTRRSLDETFEDPEYGATRDQRAESFIKAVKQARALNIAAIAILLSVWVYPLPHAVFVFILIVLPWLAVGLAGYSSGLIRIDVEPNDPHPDVVVTLLLPGVVLGWYSFFGVEVLEWAHVVAPTVCLGVALCFATWKADPNLRARRFEVFSLLIFSLLYGYGGALQANWLLDDSPPEVHRAEVLGKRTSGSDTKTYKLELGPWGPRNEPGWVSVSLFRYNSTKAGDTVCIKLYPGALKIAWFEVRTCPSEGGG